MIKSKPTKPNSKMPNSEDRVRSMIANGHPAKRFFVEMLTRDIELQDAVLDLLDNCIDGALRQIGARKNLGDTPYKGFYAHITFDERSFTIKDNCGGIPEELAEKYAFRLGRPDRERDKDLPTVGVYGIGMKRAIFKMGSKATVTSTHKDSKFTVNISPEWLADDEDWNLPMQCQDGEMSTSYGTEIYVENLYKSVSASFANDFEDIFIKSVIAHYSYIIQKGFNVKINKTPIVPKTHGVLLNIDAITKGTAGLAPFIYENDIDGVKILLAVGFYRDLPTDEEQDEELEGRHSKNNAGWTVICNDRVVLVNDKSSLSGWGISGVPAYHSQFVAISGIVEFKSNDASKLPVTTTKRGIDANSELYWWVREQMIDGLKLFTSHTNRWKSPSPERDALQRSALAISPQVVSTHIPDNKWLNIKKGLGGRRFVPTLPVPKQENPIRQIKFSRALKDIHLVSDYLFDDPDIALSTVGQECFDRVLKRAKSS